MADAPGTSAPGFRRRDRGPLRLVVDPRFEAASLALGLLDPGGLERHLAREGALRGRGHTAVVPLAGGDDRLVLRPVLRGGILGPLFGGLLWGLARPLGELAATAALREAGAPVPRPVLVAARRVAGPLWRAAVGTLLERDTVDLEHWLAAKPEPERVVRIGASAGAAIRRFHDLGGRHADLHVGNLLVRESDETVDVLVIDLDKARVTARVDAAARMAELMRLYRSLRKRRLLEVVGARGCARFFGAYTDGDRELRKRLVARMGRERLRVAIHALHYRT